MFPQYVTCKFINAKTVAPPHTPAVPKLRLDYSFPYQKIGLDYAGQFSLKIAIIQKKMVKGYSLIITCCCARAAHWLQIFLQNGFYWTLKRFISRCGIPENIISHNINTFKAIEVHNFMRYLRIKRNFIFEKSPWWGGFYEKIVRSVKTLSRK